MSDIPILELDAAGKSYRAYSSAWWRIAGWLTGRPTHFADKWVLRDVTFAVERGEAIGIVGRNGAGKSTLLKMVAGTLPPTEGRVVARGRISAILELGMGFNPEFSGRHNAAHACGLLGYGASEIDELVPWIEGFADVDEYFDQPMRTYSSGMAMRVAFAVATAVRPDILIVDEALSVGDAAFQRKSFRRIEEFLAAGTSLLFVSHGIETVKTLCSRALWIDHGSLRLAGPAKEVAEAYEKSIFSGLSPRSMEVRAPDRGFLDASLVATGIEQQYGDGLGRIMNVRILNSHGVLANTFPVGEKWTLAFEVRFTESCSDVHFGMMIKTVEGVTVYGMNTDRAGLDSAFEAGDVAEVRFMLQNNLCPGTYFLNCGASHRTPSGRGYLHRRVDVAAIKVLLDENVLVTGLANLHGNVRVNRRLAGVDAVLHE